MGRHAITGRVPEDFVPAEARPAIVREARAHWAGYLAIAVAAVGFGWWAPILLGIGPVIQQHSDELNTCARGLASIIEEAVGRQVNGC